MTDRLHYISSRVISFYAETPAAGRDIMHTQSVSHFTRMISEAEGMSDTECEIHEISAWLHDIGCPVARDKYGTSRPPYQEEEGRALVHEWLDGDDSFTKDEVDWLADVVGTHHRVAESKRLHFEPLYEADLIVNIFEGSYKDPQSFVDSGAVSTNTGLKLFRELFNVTIRQQY